jgi:hypothetical protein
MLRFWCVGRYGLSLVWASASVWILASPLAVVLEGVGVSVSPTDRMLHRAFVLMFSVLAAVAGVLVAAGLVGVGLRLWFGWWVASHVVPELLLVGLWAVVCAGCAWWLARNGTGRAGGS